MSQVDEVRPTRLRAYRRRKGDSMGDVRYPQDLAAALLCAALPPLDFLIAHAIAYRQFQFAGEEAAPRSWEIEDFMALGDGHGRSAVFAALGRLIAAKVLIRTSAKGGRGRRDADYLLTPDPGKWVFETVHPCGRFQIVEPPVDEETVRQNGRLGPRRRTVLGETVRHGGHTERDQAPTPSNLQASPPTPSSLEGAPTSSTPRRTGPRNGRKEEFDPSGWPEGWRGEQRRSST